MDRTRFWSLISLIDRSELGDGDEDAALEPLITALAKLDEPAIAGFAEQLAQVLYDLDGQVFADHAGESGGSGDGFLYARCFVVARGEQHYQRVLANPAAMPQSLDEWCEGCCPRRGRRGRGRPAAQRKTARTRRVCRTRASATRRSGPSRRLRERVP